MKTQSAIALFFILFVLNAQAQDRDKEVDVAYAKLLDYLPGGAHLIHAPYADTLETYGPNVRIARFEDEDVTGGKFLRVKVKKAGKHVWDDAVTADVGGEIKKGDVVYMVFWARIAPDDDASAEVLMPLAALQKSSAPYNKIVHSDVRLTQAWQTFAMAKKSDADYDSYGTEINFPISMGKHVLDFGPVFIFNVGQHADMRALPFLN